MTMSKSSSENWKTTTVMFDMLVTVMSNVGDSDVKRLMTVMSNDGDSDVSEASDDVEAKY